MRLNLIRFKVAAKKRGQKKENVPIGSAIKFKRNALKMTLEEASKDICSISYLSKLENNVIVPSDKYVIQLKQRFCIHEESTPFDVEIYEQRLHKLITSMLDNRSLSSSFLLDIGERTDYQTLLLRLGYHVLNQETKESHDAYHKIIPVISSMPDQEFSILICLISKILCEETRYHESNETLSMIPDDMHHLELMLCRDKSVLINAMHMDNHALFHLIYPRYQQILIQLGHYKQMNELKYASVSYFANAMSITAFQTLLQQHPRIPTPLKSLSIAKNMLFNHRYEEVISYINQQKSTKHHEWYIIKLLAYDALNDKAQIIRLLSLNKHRELSYNHMLLVGFMKAKHTYDKDMLLTYLRTVILGDHFLTDDVHTLKFLQHHAHAIFKSHFFYKEAAEVYTKFHRIIDMLKRSDYFFNKEPQALFFLDKKCISSLLFYFKYCILIEGMEDDIYAHFKALKIGKGVLGFICDCCDFHCHPSIYLL